MSVKFDDQIAFLVHRTDLRFTLFARRSLTTFGVTPEQNLLLLLLDEQPGLTQVEIGQSMVKDKTNVARLVAGVAGKGLVNRVNPAGDRRKFVVTLTDAGSAVAGGTRPVAERFQEQAVRAISADDLRIFMRVLAALNQNLGD